MLHQNEPFPAVLQRLLQLCDTYSFPRGICETGISFISLLKADQPTTVQYGIFNPGICIVIQGSKTLIYRNSTYNYGAGDYIASNLEMPIKGQVTHATQIAPYLAIRIAFTTDEIASVALDAKFKAFGENQLTEGAFIGKTGLEVLHVLERLLQLAEDREAADFLAPAVKRELIYRLLTDEGGARFYNNMLLHHDAAGISKAIQYVKTNYERALTIEEIAQAGGMSPSTLHHKFKAVTTLSPIQYQKQLRLQEARRILLTDDMDVTSAALEVGYESLTQFNREYKRFFGLPPLKDIRAISNQAKESPHADEMLKL
ncbi:AraC family transcriptional regulator [Paenibacillus radicis (ex Gao et al. 2016)]|uniref:Transcriptional regulator n=1 Tax=Paenibacillus radicis (ex Gao et al. 2016) TaxID=1737354 RepID=A0A917M0C3_9BACL|nr:AraC family transcriptional regulator [Paenibacillus radicis (ex Gao et al. 2016)]GGG69627.1 transcriptional regulator [Paenibacillus radicis (ex Gao et al. 2016)]